ncbi:MAG: serine/threonine-protein kinase [Halieaceae bacterium]|jgi:serine/threonine protein kinase|nr:serine/threonine-protein kinase [Halieaceae bacterium]
MTERDDGGFDETAFMATSMPGLSSESAPPLRPGTRLGPWKILEPIETGGMGAVYRAERADGLYTQYVALKLIRGLDKSQVSRFERERQRLAQMDHPGIAPIIDGGTAPDGRPYMVMGLVEGQPIDVALARRKADMRDKVRCFLALCEAVAHAHGKLILHHDIKPANVLVDEVGQPRLIDFGIADDLADTLALPSGGLTLRYAAPEQLRGEAGSVQTDVFSLGVLLYVVLTGAQPQRSEDGGIEVLERGLGNADLRAIIARATAASPQARYGSVGTFGTDLQAWLDGRPVAARDGGRAYRMGRFVARYPVASVSALVAVLALAVGLGASLKYGNDARREAERARVALAQAEYQYAKADAFLSAQTVLNDLLQAAYAGERGQTDAVTELLMNRWREAHENRANNPKDAAFLAFTLSRSLYLRRDYASADEVYTAWLEAGYGPEVILDAGRHLHAQAIHDSGRTAEAEPLLRAALADATRNRYTSADRFNLAFRIAKTTGNDEDIATTRAIYDDYLAENRVEDLDTLQLMEFHATAYQVYRLAEEWPSAVASLEAIVDLCNTHPDIAPPTRPAARMHLATVNLYGLRNYARAETVARRIVTEDVDSAGESVITGVGYLRLAEALRERGAFDEALDALDRARGLTARFGDGSEQGTLEENLIRARVFIDQQQYDAADTLLTGAVERWRADNPDTARLPPGLALSRLWLNEILRPSGRPLGEQATRLVDSSDLKSVQTNWLYQKIQAFSASLSDG